MNTTLVPSILLALAATTFAAEPPARSLFNGKDLTGWTGNGYTVEDGVLTNTTGGEFLFTQETFANYVLEFEYKLAPGANSGLGIHFSPENPAVSEMLEIQILDSADPKFQTPILKDTELNSSLLLLAPAKQGLQKPAGEWNHQRVSLLEAALLVELNGEIALRANFDDLAAAHPNHPGLKHRAGRIAWLGNSNKVAFRNIQITEKPLSANTEGVLAAGFVRIFNGRNFDGWLPANAPGWTSVGGIAKLSEAPENRSELTTAKPYGDFTLVFDWRWSGKDLATPSELAAGIILRGLGIDFSNSTIGSGSIPSLSITPKIKADRPLGEWNRTMVTLKNRRLSLSMNGRAVIDNAEIPNLPEAGTIGLSGKSSSIDFANLWIKNF